METSAETFASLKPEHERSMLITDKQGRRSVIEASVAIKDDVLSSTSSVVSDACLSEDDGPTTSLSGQRIQNDILFSALQRQNDVIDSAVKSVLMVQTIKTELDQAECEGYLIDSKIAGPVTDADGNETTLENVVNESSLRIIERGGLRGDSNARKEHKYVCDYCEKILSSPQSLRCHVFIHLGGKPHKCHICEQAFARPGNLKKHLRLHSGDKPFECDVCNKKFAQTNDFKRHLAIHIHERPHHTCSLCDKPFARLDSLKRHLLIHRGERPHQCSICEKRFTQSGDLKKHLMVHSGIKPYKCELCDKQFSALKSLTKHSLSHLGNETYQCTHCEDKFLEFADMKNHLVTHLLDSATLSAGSNKDLSKN